MQSYLTHLKLLAIKIGIAFLMFTLCRIFFFAFNTTHFTDIGFVPFFFGLRFDWVAISFLFTPLIVLHLLPFSFKNLKGYNKLLVICFYTANTIAIVLNLIDVAYFDFSQKRTTADFFYMISTGDDFIHLLPHYIIDFWYDYILLAGLLLLSWFLHQKFAKFAVQFHPFVKKDYYIHSLIFLIFTSLTVVGMRGGTQYKPIDIINAAQYTSPQNIPVVLNTPFTVIKTLLIDNIEPITYYKQEQLDAIYTPVQKINGSGQLKGKNVVLVILESFAKEYVGGLNNGKGYTPFIDSLLKESYVFENAYANGQRSIESLPCILAGVPQLMNSAYILSNYASNKLDGLPQLLSEEGYNTSFYHGGANGTMGFNGFAHVAGFEKYYGLNEYPNKEKDFDGLWGIFDEPYLQYYANQLNQKKEPFFSTVFTLSSHHPYTIPTVHQNQFDKGDLPIHESVGYTDFALKQFFKTAQQMPWFKNTVFIFTADHSTLSKRPKYNTQLGRYAIPIFIYDPSGQLKGKSSNYFQQVDITPTTLSLLGVNKSLITFGNDAFNQKERYIINYTNGTYQLLYKENFLIFDGENTTDFYNFKQDSLLSDNLINHLTEQQKREKQNAEQLTKAIIQQYNYRLRNNQLSLKK